jgi:catechol-2,3-dioxygenase
MASLTTLPRVQTGHIGLNVSDITRSKQFYQQVFGFEVLGESQEVGRQFVFLGQDGTPILTLWQQSEGRFATDHVGLHHLAFQADTIEAVRAFEERLGALGTAFLYDGVVSHAEGADSGGVYFEDPDGIRLEIYSPTGAHGLAAPTADAPSCGFF